MKDNTKMNHLKNLRLIQAETVLSSVGAGFSVAVITLFWNSINMDQADIGFTQMMFTISILLLDIPMGYVADRFSRKLLNIIGDIGVAFAFLFYSFAQNMYMAIISECLLGFFMAMTSGVDQALIKYNCDQIDPTGKLFRRENARVYIYRYTVMLLIMAIGGVIAKYSLRLTIGLSFIPYFVAGLFACKIKDFNEKLKIKHTNPFKDMAATFKEILKTPDVKPYLLAYMLGREVTHPQIWVFTPLMIMVGVPVEIVSLGWIFDQVMRIVGAKLAVKMNHHKTSTNFAVTISIVALWICVILIRIDLLTVWLFALNGIAVGMASGTLQAPLQEKVKPELQTSVMSIASTGERLLYVPVVYIVNYFGNIKIQYALIAVLVCFVPISMVVYRRLRKIENT